MSSLPPIYFYLPEWDQSEENLPDVNTYVQTQFSGGIYAWTLQTFLHLKAHGFPCQLVGQMPTAGIVLAHRNSIPAGFKPSSQILLVCLLADKERYPYAQVHVVLNCRDPLLQQGMFWESYFIPHWRQPGLIPRDPARGDRFESIAYFGHERNLAPELKSIAWQERLKAMGLVFKIVGSQDWHDFSQIDAVLAIRGFNHNPYTDKPATKLYNAWCAGVIAVLGPESAYQAERQSPLDYLEVRTPEETLEVLQRLRDDSQLRRAIVAHGWERAKMVQPEQVVQRWEEMITEKLVPAYDRWCSLTALERGLFFLQRYLSLKQHRLLNRWRKLEGALALRKPAGMTKT
ncbi:hypothetical protein BST81_09545 [Leptolyngbya sp. 'hensonii']|uniref:glycosyltransferase n=1 Tax=Leptolyngbya sp. 'hensonii' TaxID=1922337 RepID=UPI00094F4DC3|nr:glycosyltransferase [Leptolyngbya sp. 'hensonii']OLP18533.1 hypothetical protein BST81_09545 [Leptolyngbya sp. 'hensonii']